MQIVNGNAPRPRAQVLLGAATFAGEVQAQLDRTYLVKGWFDLGGLSMVVGPSNVGKSFLALDIAHHVAKKEDWHGVRVVGGPVLYVAAEGGSGFFNRVAALDDPRFWILALSVTLISKDSDAAALSEMVNQLADLHGRFSLIVLDTMARVMGGGDENSAPDIADLMRNLDELRTRTGAHVMLVHHSGKDLARGARGHSSLRAAVDTEITLARDENTNLISATLDKQRDGPTGLRFTYRLSRVDLGVDQDGDAVTSCGVQPGAAEDSGSESATLSGAAEIIRDTLENMLSPGCETVSISFLRKACDDADLSPSGTKHGNRMAFNRGLRALAAAGTIVVQDGDVRILTQ